MNSQYFSAFAALAGSVIGGFMMLASSWLSQKAQARAAELAHHRTRREELYADFIEVSARLYADALGHNEAELAKLVKLYALIGRMRVLSSPKIVEAAQNVANTIIETYQAPNKTFRDLKGVVNSDAIDPLRAFSETCRDELRISGPLF
ncbi:MAG: hypothetical protein WA993_15125 [Candidatus Binatus sp.]|jgi:hypothetical protein|uniref:hypothetical protein n=1 Tax=Candidatus Binatus sp. TaxID=2811406 RepID=UPI003C804FFB